MFTQQVKKRIAVGDTVPVVVDGAMQDLPVVDVPSHYRSRWMAGRYPKLVTVQLPNGHYLVCRFMPVAR